MATADRCERLREHVAQDVGQTLGRREGIEQDCHGLPDRVGELDLLLGGGRVVHHLGPVVLASGRATAQHVETNPRHNGGEPAGDVIDGRTDVATDARALAGVVAAGRGPRAALSRSHVSWTASSAA